MTVKTSPQALGVNFNIEVNDYPGGTARLFITCVGPHKLSGAGIRAILARINTYLGTTLTAPQVDALLASRGNAWAKVSPTRVDFPCYQADQATLVTNLTSDLTGAGAVVFG